MTNFLKTNLLLLALAGTILSCGQFKVSHEADGSKYQVHESGKGKKINMGDLITLNLVIKASTDSVYEDTYKRKQPLTILAQKGLYQGAFETALLHLAEGDSATIFVSADSLFSNIQQPLPPGITRGTDVKFIVKINTVLSREQHQKAQEEKRKNESKLIDDYVAKNMAGAVKGQGGLYYKVIKAGTGETIKAGQTATVEYTGKFLDGKVFDTSVGKPGPKFEIQVGQGAVIPGWEVTLSMMRKGEKALVVIPSSMAYGEQGSGGVIPPFASLVFEMEILDVK